MGAAGFIQGLKSALPLSMLTVAVGGVLLLIFFAMRAGKYFGRNAKLSKLPPPPSIPGVPIFGNLLQIKEKKPHKALTKWAETYGPVYAIKLGANSMVVLNNTDVVKEAMISKHSLMSSRKMPTAFSILSGDRFMVSTSDYNDFYKTMRRHIVAGLLSSTAQKHHRAERDLMMENMCTQFRADAISRPLEAANYRAVFDMELFGLALRQTIGIDEDELYVEELGTTLSKAEMYRILVIDLMEAVIEVDWRDFFPYLSWVPNKRIEEKLKGLVTRKIALIKAMVRKKRERSSEGEKSTCFLDHLAPKEQDLTEDEVAHLLWEPIVASSDTTSVTTEWAMYELAKNSSLQDRLFKDIQRVCGNNKVSEDYLPQLPYLKAIFQETLRRYAPVPVLLPRHVREDVEIGGHHISAGTQIVMNLYACNMDREKWEKPEEWIPDRFLDGKLDPSDLYSTMSFGAGKRVCAGSLQAMLISTCAIGRFVQEFKWRLVDGQENKYNADVLTDRKLHPLKVIAIPRVA